MSQEDVSDRIVQEKKVRKKMKLVRHTVQEVVAVVERNWEKAYLTSQQEKCEWEPLFLVGEAIPFAEIHTTTHQARLCEGRHLTEQCDVVLHDGETKKK